MWFCAALLGFSLIYAALRAIGVKETSIELRDRFTSDLAIAGFIVAMTGATFLVRIVEPQGKAVLNMQLGDFAQYLLMFAAGLFAFHANWLQRLPDRPAGDWSHSCSAARSLSCSSCSAAPSKDIRQPTPAGSIGSAPASAYGRRSSASGLAWR
jgi:hypothetical protein